MENIFSFSDFKSRFPTDDICLEEIKKFHYPNGIYCNNCEVITPHYRIKNRTAYSCEFCRHHVYPLVGTIFEKSSTSLQLWFYAMFLMTHTRANISAKQLQRELGVTYKTSWRMYTKLRRLMEENNADLLTEPKEGTIHKWVFFNKIELKVVQKQESPDK